LRFSKIRIGSSGLLDLNSTTTNARSNTIETASQPSVLIEPQPCSAGWVKAHTNVPRPAVASTAPGMS